MRIPGDMAVLMAAARLACSGCGAINQPNWHPIYARPDARARECCEGAPQTYRGFFRRHFRGFSNSPCQIPSLALAALACSLEYRPPK